MSEARAIHHCASYPMEARSPTTRPAARRAGPSARPPSSPCSNSTRLNAPLVKAPRTFSHTTRRGRSVLIASNIDSQRPERVPEAMPARLPARLRSWQGEPPQMMSTGSTPDQSTCVISPRFGTPGQRTSASLHGPGSTSLVQATRAPGSRAIRTAMSRPPYPVNRLPIVVIATTPQPRCRLPRDLRACSRERG